MLLTFILICWTRMSLLLAAFWATVGYRRSLLDGPGSTSTTASRWRIRAHKRRDQVSPTLRYGLALLRRIQGQLRQAMKKHSLACDTLFTCDTL